MKSIMRLIFPLTVVFLVACAANNTDKFVLNDAFSPEASQVRKANWENMAGTWYGSQDTKDGGTYSWIMKKSILGFYQLEGKVTKPNGESQTQVEVGEWGVGKNIYFSIFKGWVHEGKLRPSDPADPYNRDVYQILELSDTKFRYRNMDSGESFEVEKVADDFKLPQ